MKNPNNIFLYDKMIYLDKLSFVNPNYKVNINHQEFIFYNFKELFKNLYIETGLIHNQFTKCILHCINHKPIVNLH